MTAEGGRMRLDHIINWLCTATATVHNISAQEQKQDKGIKTDNETEEKNKHLHKNSSTEPLQLCS